MVLAADSAGGAGMLASMVLQAERLAGDRLRLVEVTTGEIPSRQQSQAIEEGDIGDGADLTILGRRWTDAARGKIAGQGCHQAGIGCAWQAAAAHRDRFQPLRAHHCACAGPPREAAVIGDRRVANAMLPGGADRRHPELGPKLRPQTVCPRTWRQAQQLVPGLKATSTVLDDEHAPLRSLARDG